MTTCTFIGSEQYDVDLYERIRAAVEEVVEGEDEIEFLFYRRSERFYLLCYFAVLHARHAFPGKKIVMTLFIRHGQDLTERQALPLWCFDRIVPVLLDNTSSPTPWMQIERYMVRQSNRIIAYCYPDLRWGQDRLFQYAVRRRNIRVVNVISQETAAFLKEAVAALPGEERDIVEKLNGGCTYTGLAKAAGLSVAAVRVRDSSGRRQLYSRVVRRLEQERDRQGPRASVICSLRADAPLKPCVRRCLESQRGITLLDIGNAPIFTEPRPLL